MKLPFSQVDKKYFASGDQNPFDGYVIVMYLDRWALVDGKPSITTARYRVRPMYVYHILTLEIIWHYREACHG